MKSKEKPAETPVENPSVCVICGSPATRTVDGQPSCEGHAELVYEHQLEAYTQRHLSHDEWLEKKT